MIRLSDIHEGDTITVSMWGGGTRSGIVNDTFDDIKNGRPGLDYTNDEGDWWAYLDQVISVKKGA